MIRRADPDDAPVIAALSIEVWLSTYIKHGISTEFAEYVLAEFDVARVRDVLAVASETVWVFEVRDGICGYIRISDGASAPVDGCGSSEIATLYVQSRHQGRGIGTRLVREAIALFGSGLWLKANSKNTGALAFYEATGFHRVGTTNFELGDAAYANDVMAFSLSGSPRP